MVVQVRRIDDPASETDEYRVLIGRIWPEGISSAQVHVDQWMKDLSPSEVLLQKSNSFSEFCAAYQKELRADEKKRRCIIQLLEKAQNHRVTLLHVEEASSKAQATVLQNFVKTVPLPKILVLFASEMGNTLAIAQEMAKGVRQAGIIPEVKDAFGATIDDIKKFDAFLFGSGTTGDGELPDEAQDIYDDLDELDLKGMPCAVFGAGDTSYELYCEAVNTIHSKLVELGGDLILPDFKVDFSMSEEEEKQALQLGKQFAETLWDRSIQKNTQQISIR
ncbi:DUF488 family protein [Sporolactobacillus sp. THM7-7]|nr:DUF488 family protein [Sporolactobacillus sp. THM7-7]